MDNMWLLCK